LTHEQIDRFINDLRTRLINHRHVVVEGTHFNINPEQRYDKIEIELYKDEPTHIPYVRIVFENGQTISTSWKDMPAELYGGIKAIYRYCPIKLSTIKPLSLLKEVAEVFQLNHVNTIEE